MPFKKMDEEGKEETAVPDSCFWHSRFAGDWMSYDNENIQDCVPAAAAHMIMCWTCNTRSTITKLTMDQVIAVYTRESGYDPVTGANDKACGTLTFLLHWRKLGISGNKISRYAGLDPGDRNELKLAISLFGACMIGFNMPNSAKTQRDTWQLTDPNNTQGVWGLHAVAAVGYDSDFVLVISWGRLIKVEWRFYEAYNDEGFAVLSDDWIKDGKSPAQQDLATLNTLMDNLV